MGISYVDYGLHIGSIDDIYENSTDKFDVVVSVCQDNARDNVGCFYPHYPLADDEQSMDAWGGTTEYSTFAEAAETVVAALQADSVENVLVHCHVGRNRSAAVCAAAMAVYEETFYEAAFSKLRNAREIVAPNSMMEEYARRFIQEQQT